LYVPIPGASDKISASLFDREKVSRKLFKSLFLDNSYLLGPGAKVIFSNLLLEDF
jgi:hypothetical protein